MRKTSALAIWSLVLGVLSFCLWIPALPALVLGIFALVKIGGSEGKLTGRGLAIGGLVTSGLALLATPVVLSMFLPSVVELKERAHEALARRQAGELRSALVGYVEEYGRVPILGEPVGDLQTSSNREVIDVLQGRSKELNPRGIVFLASPADGLLDPWGNPYEIALDADGDGRVTVPGAGGPESIESRIVVWSKGADGVSGGEVPDDLIEY